jgi:prepilin-type N-terminal cleavage/methylation domain-containing protein
MAEKWSCRKNGFTLVETLFSLTLFSMAVVFLYSTFVVNSRVYILENDVLELHQSTRTAMDDINRTILMTGSGVPQGAIASDLGYLFAMMPGFGGSNSPDTLAFLRGVTQVQTYLNASMPDESAILKVDDASMFTVGDVVIIQGSTQECGEALEMFQITQISTDEGQNTIQHNQNAPWNLDERLNCTYLSPSTVTRVDYIKYYIDESDPDHPSLVRALNQMTTEVLARDIENFKVTYDLLSGERGVSDPIDPNLIRKVNFRLVGRTSDEDSRWTNGVHSLTGQSDGYRRFTLRTHVYIRNIGS